MNEIQLTQVQITVAARQTANAAVANAGRVDRIAWIGEAITEKSDREWAARETKQRALSDENQ